MLDLTKPVQTRDGRRAEILAKGLKLERGESIVGLIWPKDGGRAEVASWQEDGHYLRLADTDKDLVNVPETLKTWHVSGFDAKGDAVAHSCLSEAGAISRAGIIRQSGGRALITPVEGIPT